MRNLKRCANIKRIKSNLYVESIFLIQNAQQAKKKQEEAEAEVEEKKIQVQEEEKRGREREEREKKIATTAQNYQVELNWNFILMTTFVRV